MDQTPRPKRSNVFMDAHLNLGEPLSASQLVRIRDISEGGARIQGKSPGVGARIVVTRGETAMPGRVVWTADRHFGVAFDEPVDVESVLKAAAPQSPAKPAYADALTSGLTHFRRNPVGRGSPSTFGLKRTATGR
ncbi:PilZ domain-containing protein [Sphingobium sp. CR2-8]|uniref:PilZ domain-containing protein n=1 Tax=Sphingobium sp. CR2-8 TaxID=1306534 RepID=UPI002DBF2F0B|nr:PilZ domain-containing protein [Sphingobium sp. CR2-8]MEC3912517.1 PilZ domain-containing protein [Sphingobium sp. CR2-8]